VSPGSLFRRDVPAAEPDAPESEFQPIAGSTASTGIAPLGAGLGSRQDIQAELDAIAQSIRGFHLLPPDTVLRLCSAYGARLSELSVLLHRSEMAGNRNYVRIRTMQVGIFAEQIEFQFKVHSRLVELQRQDIAMLGGAV